jgi:membrane-bound lytic murein transglycosylase D
MPLELKYLPVIESALNPRAVSRVGATGLWQFMYGTGRMYNLQINSYIDERRSPYKSSMAAAQYLSDLHAIYKDWILVIAAYNCGPGNVNKAIRRAGGKRDYWDIYFYLPRETRGYVPAFIAAAYFMNFAPEHNLKPAKIEMPILVDTIILKEKVHFEQIAQVLNVSTQMLRDLNPEYRQDIVPGSASGMPLTLPQDVAFAFIDHQDSILAYKDSIYLNPKIVFEEAPKYSASSYSGGSSSYNYSYSPPDIAGKKKVYYTVKSGDAISLIANWYDVNVNDIKYWNNLQSSRISVGQKLTIFVPADKESYYSSINTQKPEQKSTSLASAAPQKQEAQDPNFVYYTIRKGDNIWDIARQFPGVSDADIMRLNGLTSSSVQKLQPGDMLKIKRK